MTVQEFYPTFLKYPQICTDSRLACSNSIFFALKGDSFDGNKYAKESLSKGCIAAIVDDPTFETGNGVVYVDDVLVFLQELASYHRDQFDIPVIGLTGTNGKTTTKELIAAVLQKKYRLTYTQGNLNNHIGVPLTVLKATKETQILLVEMGANHIGEIEFLCSICKPNCGLITNIGRAHLEGFGSFEGVVKAKTELYRYLDHVSGQVFVNQDDELLLSLIGKSPYIPYGNGAEAGLRNTVHGGFMLAFDLDFKALGAEKTLTVNTQLVGKYNLSNALAALAVGAYFGLEYEEAISALEDYKPDLNRSEYRETENNVLILDAYNANPASMIEAIKGFSELEANNKLAILGEMREMGKFSEDSHKEIFNFAKAQGFELILVGNEFVNVGSDDHLIYYESVEKLIEYVKINPIVSKTILLKGSRGNKLEKLLPYL